MTDYPEALRNKVRLAIDPDGTHDVEVEVLQILDALGFAPYVGSQYWRSAIHVEDYK